MKKLNFLSVVGCLVLIGYLTGCGGQQPKSANAKEAITTATAMKTVDEQTKYLVSEANAFVNNENFDDAIKTAKHVLGKLDAESKEAKSIIEKAKVELEAMAREKAEKIKADLKAKMGSLGGS